MNRVLWPVFLELCAQRLDGVGQEAQLLLRSPAGAAPGAAERMRARLAQQGDGAARDLTALLAAWRAAGGKIKERRRGKRKLKKRSGKR